MLGDRRPTLVLLAACVVALAIGCATRERRNPFDPANPVTGGRPSGFRAAAGDARVTLSWSPASSPDLLGFQLFRRVQGETAFQALSGLLPPATGSFTDVGLGNGIDHAYRLFFVFRSGLGPLFAEDTGTPGPIRPYVTEFLGGSRVTLTPDGRYVRSRTGGFIGPSDIAVDRQTGVVWTVDAFDGAVEVWDPGAGQAFKITGLSEPVAVALDLANETAWVCDSGQDAVLHYMRDGNPASPPQLSVAIDNPIAADVDIVDRTLWVCERFGNRVRAFTADGTPLWAATLAAPSRVAVDSVTHNGWVTSFINGTVYWISALGSVIDSVTTLSGPIGVSVDVRRGRVWVADALGGALVAMDRGGLVEFRVTDLPQVREVDVDLRTGNAWATVPGRNSVFVVSPTGVVLRETLGLNDPSAIAIDPGP